MIWKTDFCLWKTSLTLSDCVSVIFELSKIISALSYKTHPNNYIGVIQFSLPKCWAFSERLLTLCFDVLKPLFVRIFYYLLTQPFETKETTIFSLLQTVLSLSFFCFPLLYQKIFFADISMGVHPRNKIPYNVFKPNDKKYRFNM